MSETAPRRGRRRVLLVCGGIALAVVSLGMLLHTPPIRGLALRYAVGAARSAGLTLEAGRLDYNLATLEFALMDVRVAAAGEEAAFFTASRVEAVASTRVLSGVVALEEVTVAGGRVLIVSRADGSTNLPRSSGSREGDPPPIPVDRFQASRLRVDYRDEGRNITLAIPAVTVDLSAAGRIALDEPAEFGLGSTSTRIDRLESAVAFDGRDLRLTGLRLTTSEMDLDGEGSLAIIRREPAVDLHVSGDGNLETAARWWGQSQGAPRGALHIDGDVRGPLGGPSADLQVKSEGVRWNDLDARNISARLRLDGNGLTIEESAFGIAGGEVVGSGEVEWESLDARLMASWRDVATENLLASLVETDILPSGVASGELTAGGSLNAYDSWTGTARLTLGEGLSGKGRVSIPGEARLRLARDRWELDARHRAGGVIPIELALGGRLRSANLSDSSVDGTVRTPSSDLEQIVGLLADLGIEVPRDMVSGSIRGEATVGGTVSRPGARLNVESDAVRVTREELVNLRARGRLSGSAFELDELTAEQPSSGDGDGPRGRVRVSGRYDTARGSYAGSVAASLWRIAPTADVPLSAVVGLEYSGTGQGTRAFGKGRVVASFANWQGVDLDEVVTDVELTGDQALLKARAPRFSAAADARMALAAPYETTITADASGLDLATSVRGARLPVSVTGTADLRVEANGSLEQWRDGRASVEIRSLDGRLEMLPVTLRGPARASYEGRRARIDQLEASVGETSLSASGALPVWNESGREAGSEGVLVTLTGDLHDVILAMALVDAARQSPAPLLAAGKGPLSILARVRGTVASPAVSADLEVGPATLLVRTDLPPIEQLQARAHVENGLLELREFTGLYQGARIAAQGEAPLSLLSGGSTTTSTGQARFRGTAAGVTSAILSPFVDKTTLDRIGGSLDAHLDLSAAGLAPDALSGELVIDRLDLSVAQLPVRQREPTRIVARDGLARVEAWTWESEGTSLNLDGQVRLRDREAALIATGTLDARLFTPFIAAPGVATAGQVATRLLVTGPIDAPTVNGDLRLENGEVRVREPRLVANDLAARATLARSEVYLTSLTGSVNGGSLRGSGRLQYAPDLRGRLSVDLSGMAMEFPEGLRTEVDSALQLTLAPAPGGDPAGRLSGLVTVTRGAYREPLALVAGLLAGLERSASTAGTTRSPILDALALDVRIVTEEDLTIANNVARAQLGADLRVINVASAPALSGRAELREGGQLFLGRNTYTVESGTIDFTNATVIEPVLGIRARTRVAGEEIEVQISGPPDSLKTDLTSPSDPDLGQVDLTSLLLTGRRLEDLNDQQASEVGAQVLGNLAGDVLGFAGRAVGLDTLRVGGVETTSSRDPADLASEVDPTSRLTFGKSLGSSFDVTLSQSLVEGGAQTWIIDYLPVRRVALRFVSDDDEFRSYEFRHDVMFGAPASIRSAEVSREVRPARVSAVHLTGDLGVAETEVRQRLRLGAGDRFDFIEWQEDRDRLERFYHGRHRLTARVTATRSEVESGLELRYEIATGPETLVEATGVQLPGDAIAALENAWARSVFDAFLIEEAEVIVRQVLARQGVYQAEVAVRFEEGVSTRTMSVEVVPGPRMERIDVRFEGVTDALGSELRGAAGDRSTLERALASPVAYEGMVRAALQSRGYVQATVVAGAPVVETSTVTVPVTISAGPQFRVGRVTVDGAAALGSDEVRKEAALDEGGVYRADDAEAARLRVQTRLRREGYATASVDLRQEVRQADAAIDLTLVVQQGEPQIIGEVAVSGSRSVSEDVVDRALRLKVGERLRANDWLEARRRLFETGLFRRVDIAVEPIEGAPEGAPVRLRVLLEEWPALRVRYGFQVAEERPEEEVSGRDLVPGVSADATRRTLFGRAISLGVAAQYERRERLGRVFMSTPTLFGLPVQSSLVLEHSREDQRVSTLVANRTTAAWEQRARHGALSLSYGLRFERNRTFDTDPLDPDFPLDLTVRVGRFTSSVTWDTRDDPADSSTGTFLSSSLDHASRRLGSDVPFVRSLSQAYHFRSWRGIVLASAVRFGVVRPIDDVELLSDSRFFAGGARTVRGVEEDGLGARDFLGSPAGGEGLLLFNQEARFPIYRWVRGVAFVDTGNVFADAGEIRLGGLVGSAGLGLRVVTPLALLRVDYGKTVWNGPAQDSGRWVVGIGHAF